MKNVEVCLEIFCYKNYKYVMRCDFKYNVFEYLQSNYLRLIYMYISLNLDNSYFFIFKFRIFFILLSI